MNVPKHLETRLNSPFRGPGGAMVAIVDCNSFYCSCERVFRPDLWNKPVVVLPMSIAAPNGLGSADCSRRTSTI